MRALSILDVALWNLNARARGCRSTAYLGTLRTTETCREVHTSSGVSGRRNFTRNLAGFAAYVRQGFRASNEGGTSLPRGGETGRAPPGTDAPNVLLMLDVNNAWANLPRRCSTASALQVRYSRVEEPSSPTTLKHAPGFVHRYSTSPPAESKPAVALQGNPGEARSQNPAGGCDRAATESPNGAGSRRRRPATT